MDGIAADWVTTAILAALLAGVTISVVALAAVGSIRRGLNDGMARQSQQIRRLAETVATLNAQQQAAQTRIQQLTDANRTLSESVTALGERLGEADAAARTSGTIRLLH